MLVVVVVVVVVIEYINAELMVEIKLKLTNKYFHILPNQRRNKKILELCKSFGTIFTSVNSQKVPALIPKISPCGQVHKSAGVDSPGHAVLEDPQVSKPSRKAKTGKGKHS